MKSADITIRLIPSLEAAPRAAAAIHSMPREPRQAIRQQ